MIPLKFNFKDLEDLSADLKASPRALSVIIQRVLTVQLRELRNRLRPPIPRGTTGGLQRSFGASVRKQRGGGVLATFGFLRGRRVSANTAIAANVLQKPGATARKGMYLWIPLRSNRNVNPRDFYAAEDTFIRTSKSGNRIAFIRHGNEIIPLFVLKHAVRLHAAPIPIESSVEGKLPEITEDIQTSIAQVIEARKAALGVING